MTLYPLEEHTRDEAVKVVAFGMHKPRRRILNEDTRSGFVVLGGVAAFLLVVAGVVVALIAYGVAHR